MSIESELAKRDRLLAEKSARIRELEAQLAEAEHAAGYRQLMCEGEMRGKCRTCRYLSLNEGNWSSGYCWQTDKHVQLMSYADFPKQRDPGCREVHGEESAWEPTMLLEPYFEGVVE